MDNTNIVIDTIKDRMSLKLETSLKIDYIESVYLTK